MKREIGSVRFFFLLFLMISGGLLSAQILDRPVAIVRLTETVNIGQRELRQQVELLERQLGGELTLENRREVLDAQIGDVLLNQAAARANIRVTQDEIDQALAAQRQSIGRPVSDAQFRQLVQDQMGLSWERFIEEITNRLTQEKLILQESQGRLNQIAEPSTREIRQIYEENARQFTNPAMVRFDHLFFDLRGQQSDQQSETRRLADSFARRIERGTGDFDTLLRESLDDVRYAGGDFGYLVRGEQQAVQRLGREFVDGVFEFEEGRSRAYWRVVRVSTSFA